MKAQELYNYVVKAAVEYGYADAQKKAQAEASASGDQKPSTPEPKKK